MKLIHMFGLGIFFCSINLLAAGGIGVPKKEDVPKYLKQLQSSPSAADRARAAEMLGKRGGINANDVDDAVEPLQAAMKKDKDAGVRAASARALGNIHPEAADTVPLLVDRLKNDSSMDVKMATVVALGQYGSDAKEAVPALNELRGKFNSKKSKEAQTIMNTLQMITGKKKKKA
jgi:HEAT repeat protein